MLALFVVEISNNCDDTQSFKVLYCDVEDTNAITYISEMASLYINLDDSEYISDIKRVIPLNISTDMKLSDRTANIFG